MVEDKIPWTVYALLDPRTELPHYVGVTTRSLAARLAEHQVGVRGARGTAPIDKWIKTLAAVCLAPMCVPLERGSGIADGAACERRNVYDYP